MIVPVQPLATYALLVLLLLILAATELVRFLHRPPTPHALCLNLDGDWRILSAGGRLKVQPRTGSLVFARWAMLCWRQADGRCGRCYVYQASQPEQWRRFKLIWHWARASTPDAA